MELMRFELRDVRLDLIDDHELQPTGRDDDRRKVGSRVQGARHGIFPTTVGWGPMTRLSLYESVYGLALLFVACGLFWAMAEWMVTQ